ncbi:adenylyl-sulfate kinase [Campylobacter volucris]|uniref:Adenylyl-sulfate kinase n=2 Tax=Campylobacter volucris TaxID=1031542 RepID=A0AAE6CZD6_9BACT|nr:adenylyl-sulfate kinase [Campylobacter volucris]AJC94591.1 adenylylsulfate kinase [Campylobacter volucris LMG 24379]KAB0577679.1 adenylyl-sulfate kinase [Campylobacter volucris]QBL13061.1 adenylyl-sulfate kinase [Campylobacter volucris]QEL08808.1 adenylylsulfate kinase [Campylobacter volucris]TXK71459.1 adenylyl-sulfate kinase [Campylobacter volucris]
MKITNPIISLTGLAGSGKSTIGKVLYAKLQQKYPNIIYLDGDEFRDLLGAYDYDKKSRIDLAIKRSNFAKFLNNQNMIVIITTISMFNEIYKYNRENFKNYVEIYIKCDLQELIRRDQKGLYTQALEGKIKNVVGIDINFDEPNPHLIIKNSHQDKIEEKTQMIIDFILQKTNK